MAFTHLNNLLHVYKDCFHEEKSLTTKMIQFINNDENCFKRDNWYGHFTGSAWVVDSSREWVLMTHHRQLNLWLQFGGHADGCYNLLEVALKETREESGLNQFDILSDKIFDLEITSIPAARVFGAVSSPARNAAGASSESFGGRSAARISNTVLKRTCVND